LAEHVELRDTQLRLLVAVALTVPLVALRLAPHLFHAHSPLNPQMNNWMGCLLGTPVVFWSGWRFFVKAGEALKAGTVSALQLTAVRTGGAWVYSVVASLVPSLFPTWMRAADGSVAVYFEAASAMTVFVLLNQFLELRRTPKPLQTAPCCASRQDGLARLCCA
jgi:Cu+-exporting ATPase